MRKLMLWKTLAVAVGILCGILAGGFYSGKWLLSLGRDPQLEGDVIIPPGVGFNYLHNLKELPEEVYGYTGQITRLTVRGGRIKEIISINDFSFLTALEVSDNDLRVAPPEIGNLSLVEILNLGGNKLKSVPPEIGNLTNLKKLYLYDNKLKSLPEEIGFLTNLEILDLHLNSLTTLPATIGNLTNLKFLYLGGNKIPRGELENIPNLLPNTTIFF